jgi:hypothetical protein
MTGMDDLVTWLRAQLDEDERVTRQVIAEPGGFYIEAETEDVNVMTVGAYVYRWTPKRILAEVDAKRRILDEHRLVAADDVPGLVQCGLDGETMPCDHVRLLALPYADRPGYDESWRP